MWNNNGSVLKDIKLSFIFVFDIYKKVSFFKYSKFIEIDELLKRIV